MVFAVIQYTDGSSLTTYGTSYEELLSRVDTKPIATLDARLVSPDECKSIMSVKKE